MASKRYEAKLPTFDYSFPKMQNVFVKFTDQPFFWCEKIDGANVTFFSNGDVCSRLNKLCLDKKGKLNLNGVDLLPEKQKLVPIFESMMNELKITFKGDFKINIVGEVITKGQSEAQARYNKDRFETGEMYYYGMVIYDYEEFIHTDFMLNSYNVFKVLDNNDTNPNSPRKYYLRLYLNDFLVEFFNRHGLKTPETFGEFSFEEFLKNDYLLQKIVKSEIEGYVLTTKEFCVKFKNIVENENSLYFIKQRVKEYKTCLRDLKIEILMFEQRAKSLQSNIDTLDRMNIYYNSNPEFANHQIIENLVVKVINQGSITEQVTKLNLYKFKNIIYNKVLNELAEINMNSDKRNINGIITKKFIEMNIYKT